jgi:aminomethyltransferase
MGHAYPMPGLHAKYYDQEMVPLVEVNGTPAVAMTPLPWPAPKKYYNDMGYPGHAELFDQFQSRVERLQCGCVAVGWRSISFSTPALMITA